MNLRDSDWAQRFRETQSQLLDVLDAWKDGRRIGDTKVTRKDVELAIRDYIDLRIELCFMAGQHIAHSNMVPDEGSGWPVASGARSDDPEKGSEGGGR